MTSCHFISHYVRSFAPNSFFSLLGFIVPHFLFAGSIVRSSCFAALQLNRAYHCDCVVFVKRTYTPTSKKYKSRKKKSACVQCTKSSSAGISFSCVHMCFKINLVCNAVCACREVQNSSANKGCSDYAE